MSSTLPLDADAAQATMAAVVGAAKTAFQSRRLRYIKIDETNEDIKAFMAQVEGDPATHSLANPSLFRPQGRKDIDNSTEQFAKSFLGVAMCLLPSEEEKGTETKDPAASSTSAQADGGNASGDDTGKTTGTIIGTMCLGWGGIPAAFAHHRNAQLGIVLADRYQGRGYGREAINWMLDWAFRHGGLHTVSLTTSSFNERGIHLYGDMGFRLEGRRRQVIWFDRRWHDELWFGMTEEEWERLRGLR
ncbi:endoglucanase B [Purpureocillium lavendulum]|uniref:Endoglucanase B n=1 Tax=Purpureocillium lavendulum TaxID=1247861 RepID=A0AB34G6W8_9HYPO|nr:endoglucanase B [Purpureocillium lavendulum]